MVDERDNLLGVITVDDLVEVLEEETTEDIQRFGGAELLDRPYLNSSALRHFQQELDMMVTLAFFVPLLIGTGGNAGSQATSTIIQALGMNETSFGDTLLVLWHEIRTGIILGSMMSAIAFARALTWGVSTALALAVSISILIIVIWANGLGSLLPLLVARTGIDPTVVSSPVMSTLVDATGLFIYFTIAKLMFCYPPGGRW